MCSNDPDECFTDEVLRERLEKAADVDGLVDIGDVARAMGMEPSLSPLESQTVISEPRSDFQNPESEFEPIARRSCRDHGHVWSVRLRSSNYTHAVMCQHCQGVEWVTEPYSGEVIRIGGDDD